MKILTWNVQWFKGLDEVVDIKRVIEHARSMAGFDAICMQEVAVNYRALTGETEPDQIKTLRALLPGFEVVFSPAVDELSPCGGFRRQFGNVIASRVPIRQIQHFALPHPPAASSEPTPSMPRIACTCSRVRLRRNSPSRNLVRLTSSNPTPWMLCSVVTLILNTTAPSMRPLLSQGSQLPG